MSYIEPTQISDFVSGMIIGYIFKSIQDVLDAIKYRLVKKIKGDESNR